MLCDKGHLELKIPALQAGPQSWSHTVSFPLDRSLYHVTDEVVESLCREALQRTGGRRNEAARMLGISRNSLYRYMTRLGLMPETGTESEPS